MKALGTGIGGFALTDVEVCRTTGKGARATRPIWRFTVGRRVGRRRGAATLHLSLTHTDGVAIAFVVAEQAPVRAVLTREEMRAADAAALADVSHETLVRRAGTAVAHAALRMLGGAYGRRVVVVAGKGSNGADGRVAAALLAARGPVCVVVEAAADRAPAACDLVIDGAYGTGFRGSYDAPRRSGERRVLAIDIPSGVDADSGEAPGAAVAGRADGDVRRPQAGLLQGDGPCARPGRGGRHRDRVPHAADAAGRGRRRRPPPGPAASATSGRPRSAWRPARPAWKGAAVLCTRGAMAAGAGMIRLGSPGDPAAAWPTEAVRMHLPARAGPTPSWRRRPSARRW